MSLEMRFSEGVQGAKTKATSTSCSAQYVRFRYGHGAKWRAQNEQSIRQYRKVDGLLNPISQPKPRAGGLEVLHNPLLHKPQTQRPLNPVDIIRSDRHKYIVYYCLIKYPNCLCTYIIVSWRPYPQVMSAPVP